MTDIKDHWRAVQQDEEGAVEALYDAAKIDDMPAHIDAAILNQARTSLAWWQVRWPVASAAVVVLAVTLMIPGIEQSGDTYRMQTTSFSPDQVKLVDAMNHRQRELRKTTKIRLSETEKVRAVMRAARAPRAGAVGEQSLSLDSALLCDQLSRDEFARQLRLLSTRQAPEELTAILEKKDVTAEEISIVCATIQSEVGLKSTRP